MRDIATILKDDKSGKRLSQTEQRVVTAYMQGKYDAIRELKIDTILNNLKVLTHIKVEISSLEHWCNGEDFFVSLREVVRILDKYQKESEGVGNDSRSVD